MGEGTPPEGALSAHPQFSAEILKFIQAFGARALVSAALGRKQAMETLLTRVAGVQSARIEMTDTGEIERIHVVPSGRFSPVQQKRHIQSALLAAHNLNLDPRLISLVPLKEDFENGAGAPSVSPRQGRVRINQLGYQQEGFKITAHLELEWDGQTFFGFDRDADTARGRMMAAARAALRAVENIAEQQAAFFLEGLDVLQKFDRKIVVASVRVVSEPGRASLVGCASVGQDPNYTAAQAVVAAVNRPLTRFMAAPRPGQNGAEPPPSGDDDPETMEFCDRGGQSSVQNGDREATRDESALGAQR
jgi:hypothetical protein